jgi:hypothetical protein
MRHRVGSFLLLAIACGMPLVLACRPGTSDAPRGEALGTFVVRGSLEENGCSPGLDPVDPLEFRVDLSRDEGYLTWRMTAGGPPVQGSLSSSGDFRLRTTMEVEAWPADAANEIRGCWISQVETITCRPTASSRDGGAPGADAETSSEDAGVQMGDAGVASGSSFEAVSRIEIVPLPGSDCTPLLLANGGSFPSLPCSARYSLASEVR